jgi:integrase/recombinase XerC
MIRPLNGMRWRWPVVARRVELEGRAHLELAQGVRHLHPEEAMFEAMLRGWRAQQTARILRDKTIADRELMIRRFAAFTNEYPWAWQPAHVEEWITTLVSERRLAHATVRVYEVALRLFTEYLVDPRYGWAAECKERFGAHPVRICHEWNTASHRSDYEGRPARRPFTRAELQALLDYADAQVEVAQARKRKGALAAYRDATALKVVYAWGLRRREAVMLDSVDFGRNPAAPELGRFGMLSVRYGKAVRGQPPRRRSVASVMPWAVEAVEDYFTNIRPRFGLKDHPALWVTERGGRLQAADLGARFDTYRGALGLPPELDLHCLRHAYVTHLIEDGVDPGFVQRQVGHTWASTTAIYTGVSGDFMNAMLRKALEPALRSAREQERS